MRPQHGVQPQIHRRVTDKRQTDRASRVDHGDVGRKRQSHRRVRQLVVFDEVVALASLSHDLFPHGFRSRHSRLVDERTREVNRWTEQLTSGDAASPLQLNRRAAQRKDRRDARSEIEGSVAEILTRVRPRQVFDMHVCVRQTGEQIAAAAVDNGCTGRDTQRQAWPQANNPITADKDRLITLDPFAVHRDHVDVDDGGSSDARRRLRRLRRRNRQHEEDCRHWRVPDRTSIQHAGRNEEWKQTPAGGEHRVNPSEALSNPSLELKLLKLEPESDLRRTRNVQLMD